jgi:hypothetical protein
MKKLITILLLVLSLQGWGQGIIDIPEHSPAWEYFNASPPTKLYVGSIAEGITDSITIITLQDLVDYRDWCGRRDTIPIMPTRLWKLNVNTGDPFIEWTDTIIVVNNHKPTFEGFIDWYINKSK